MTAAADPTDKKVALAQTSGKPDPRDGKTPRYHPSISPWMVIAAVVLGLVVGVLLERMTIGLPAADASSGHLAAYVGATMLGLLVGATELVARYRDAPRCALESPAGMIYMATNAGVSLGVFWLLRTGQIGGNPSSALGPTLSQVLLAGIGGMALLRTSVFTLRLRDKDIAAGPRAVEVRRLMEGISFDRAKPALPAHCLALM